MEALEARVVLAGVVISEFQASNNLTLADEDGDFSDWIELYNSSLDPVDITGWHLTDDATDYSKWTLGADHPIILETGEFKLVFASGKDRTDPAAELHTNFRLSAAGEFLALVEVDGQTIASQYAPEYPTQLEDHSYGLTNGRDTTVLIDVGASVSAFVPTDNALGLDWTEVGFNDAGWTSGTTAVGYEQLAAGFSVRDEFDNPLGPEWTVDIPAGGTSTVDVTGGNLRMDVPPGQNSTADRGLAPIVFRDPPDQNSNYDFIARITRVSGNTGASGLVVLDEASGQQVLSVQWNRQSSFLSQIQTSVFERTLNTRVEFNLSNAFLRIHRDLSNDTWTTYFRSDDAQPWTELLTVTEGDGDVPQIASPKIGVMTRTPSSEYVTDFDFFELQVADEQAIYGPQTGLDVEGTMFNANSSIFTRFPFSIVGDPAQFDELDMPIRYDDGFVAYLNGVEIARRNAPEGASWDAAATDLHGSVSGEIPVEIVNLDAAVGLLQEGDNVLALHGLNTTADDSDFFVLPQLAAINTSGESEPGYFASPTPGALNPDVPATLGPFIEDVTHTPNEPTAADAVVVTARIVGSSIPVSDISLNYRVMYNAESTVPMVDDGSGQDAVAGDSIYTGVIPAGVASPGEMLRYYISSLDTLGNGMRSPRITDTEGTDRSPEYYGTVVADPTVTSELTILYWFAENPAAGRTRTGTRASVFYAGEFYDNIFVRQRGGATNASSQKFNFDDDHPFYVSEKLGRVAEFNLNAQGSDPSYIRQTMAYQAYTNIGNQSSESFLTRVELNGNVDRVGVFIEQVDENFLERHDLDPEGALYKFVQRSNLDPVFNDTITGIEKKTRLDEGLDDLQALVDGLNLPTAEERKQFLYDNINLPQLMNYLAGRTITMDADDVRKNFYGYRDTNGNGEWYIFPWDKDWTFGVEGDGAPHLHNPFFGDEDHSKANADQWNVLYEVIFEEPTTREMFLRRLRTTMDEWLQPPDTPADELWFENRVDEIFAPAAPHLGGGPAGAINGVKNFFPTRRNDLYNIHSIDNLSTGQPTDIISEFVDGVRYFVPSDNSLGTSWTGLADPANIADWGTGQAGVGYEDAPGDYQNLIRTQVRPLDTCATCTSIYLRVPFEIEDMSAIRDLTLQMKYDDGFIAYLNGTEVARSAFLGAPGFDMTSIFGIEHSGVEFQDFLISDDIGLLNDGANVLAIHSFNSSATNSDQLISPVLVNGTFIVRDVAGIPHEQIGNPQIDFGDIDYDPASGNQDEEYIQLINPHDTAVDLSSWRLVGGIDHVIQSGTVIPAGGSLYVTPNVNAFRARTTGPSRGQALFVQGDYQGHISSFGETIELLGADGSLISSVTTPSVATDVQRYLRVSELHYNPADNEDTEFIELTNISNGANATDLDLSGVTITDGPSEPFVIPDGTMLSPGAYLLVVSDPTAFQAAYPQVDANIVLGPFAGRLSNGGERIKVDDVNGGTIVDFTYSDSDPWTERADGAGASLELIDPAGTPREQIDKHYRWRGSSGYGGSPGGTSAEPVGIVINEVLAHTDPPVAQSDSIELLNPTTESIDISGWFLSDAGSDLQKFQIPAGTILGPGDYIVFDEDDFNPSGGVDPELHPQDFALSGASGDDIYLVIPDGNGGIATFVDDVHFGASPNGESIGRVSHDDHRLAPMSTLTLGGANSPPRVGPLTISEINYDPGVPSAAALAADVNVTSDDLEFIEIHNPTDSSVLLTDWRIRGGADFDFDAGTSIAAGETLVIISFNPESVLNADRLAAFRAHYGLDEMEMENVQLLGGYGDQLSDSGERVQLQRPDEPPPEEPTLIPRLSEDEVLYDNLAPWASSAAGEGNSLRRRGPELYGNSAGSWLAATPSPGTVDFDAGVPGDLTGDGVVDAADINTLLAAINTGNAPAEFDLDGNSVVDQADVRFLVEDILGTFLGDANLDDRVNATDLNQVGLNWLETNVGGWQSGDFNGDGVVNAMDLNVIGLNWRSGEAAAALTEANDSDPRRIPRAPLAAEAKIPPIATDAAFADQYGGQAASFLAPIERPAQDRGVIVRYPRLKNIAETLAQRVASRIRFSGASSERGMDYQLEAESAAEVDAEIVDQIFASLVSLSL